MYEAHVNLIQHGRKVCHAQRPDHDACPLRDRAAASSTRRRPDPIVWGRRRSSARGGERRRPAGWDTSGAWVGKYWRHLLDAWPDPWQRRLVATGTRRTATSLHRQGRGRPTLDRRQGRRRVAAGVHSADLRSRCATDDHLRIELHERRSEVDVIRFLTGGQHERPSVIQLGLRPDGRRQRQPPGATGTTVDSS